MNRPQPRRESPCMRHVLTVRFAKSFEHQRLFSRARMIIETSIRAAPSGEYEPTARCTSPSRHYGEPECIHRMPNPSVGTRRDNRFLFGNPQQRTVTCAERHGCPDLPGHSRATDQDPDPSNWFCHFKRALRQQRRTPQIHEKWRRSAAT